MTEKPTRMRGKPVRFESLDTMPAPEPLSTAFRALSDAEVEQRAAEDPDACFVPPDFWLAAVPKEPENKEQITLRLDAEVLRHFRSSGKGYQSRINAVLKSYVQAHKPR